MSWNSFLLRQGLLVFAGFYPEHIFFFQTVFVQVYMWFHTEWLQESHQWIKGNFWLLYMFPKWREGDGHLVFPPILSINKLSATFFWNKLTVLYEISQEQSLSRVDLSLAIGILIMQIIGFFWSTSHFRNAMFGVLFTLNIYTLHSSL